MKLRPAPTPAAALLFLVSLSSLPASTHSFSFSFPFFSSPTSPKYLTENLINTGSLGLPRTGIIAAYGDYNSDQLLDLFQLSSDQRSVSVWLWDRPSYTWKEKVEARLKLEKGVTAVNVVPGDWNYDGKLDLLVMGSRNTGGWWGGNGRGTGEELEMLVYLQQGDGSFSQQHSVNSSTSSQPMILDSTGNMRPDLLGFAYASGEPDSATAPVLPTVWENTWESSNGTSIFSASSSALPFSTPSSFNCTSPSPHSNAFIDLNGDCLADLFLMCEIPGKPDELEYQIWINDKSLELDHGGTGGFRLERTGRLPSGTKSVGFADMDRDGTIDMIIASCPSGSSSCLLSIAYNQQIPLCTTQRGGATVVEKCRDPEDLCIADEDFTFDLSLREGNDALTSTLVSSLIPSGSLITSSTSFKGIHPTPPQIGDFNIDGYPDLLILTSHSLGVRKVSLLQNIPCGNDCSTGLKQRGRRSFKKVTVGAEVLEKLRDVESCSWFDLDDDGSLDIMIQRSGNGGAARRVEFIKNNYFHDAFFLKATVLNGACQGWCEPQNVGESRYRPYGVSYSGASYKFTVLDPTGARKATQVGQLPQSSYLALGTPYSYFGLGRTNNYVENLFVGSTLRQLVHFISIEGLIPNSQVVIDPWQPENGKDPSTWSKELYLHPGDWIPWVTLVLGAAIGLLGIVVFILNVGERKEDEKERKDRLLSLNFHAL